MIYAILSPVEIKILRKALSILMEFGGEDELYGDEDNFPDSHVEFVKDFISGKEPACVIDNGLSDESLTELLTEMRREPRLEPKGDLSEKALEDLLHELAICKSKGMKVESQPL